MACLCQSFVACLSAGFFCSTAELIASKFGEMVPEVVWSQHYDRRKARRQMTLSYLFRKWAKTFCNNQKILEVKIENTKQLTKEFFVTVDKSPWMFKMLLLEKIQAAPLPGPSSFNLTSKYFLLTHLSLNYFRQVLVLNRNFSKSKKFILAVGCFHF